MDRSGALRSEDRRIRPAIGRPPDNPGRPPPWRNPSETAANLSETEAGPCSYTTASGFLKQPDKQELASWLGGEVTSIHASSARPRTTSGAPFSKSRPNREARGLTCVGWLFYNTRDSLFRPAVFRGRRCEKGMTHSFPRSCDYAMGRLRNSSASPISLARPVLRLLRSNSSRPIN